MSTESGTREYGRFDELAEEFAERHRRGERPGLQEYIDRLPEMADEIRQMFSALVEVVQVERDVREDAIQPPPAVPRLGQIGDYRILRAVGRGGMGVVYEAEQISLGRRVALKVLPGPASGDRVIQERFRREARAAARLHHTNIVPVYEVGQDGDVRFYAMQFIDGLGLDAVIAELRRLLDRARSQPGIQAASGGRSPRPGGGPSRHGIGTPTLGAGVEVSAVLRSILTGRFDTGRRNPDPAGASPSMPAGTDAGGPAMPSGVERESRPAGSDGPLSRTDACGAAVGDRTGSHAAYPLDPSSATSSPTSAILPGGSQLSSVESGRRGFFRSLAQIGRQVAGGLAYAHARGIVHRDIKPSNLLLDTDGVVWIADFGLAKGDDEGLTQSGDILGTLRYMAPERFRGEGDARADVYALGLTLYELLTLRPAFESSDRLKLMERIKTEEPARPRSVDGRIPRDLETIVLKAIEKDPKARYQAADAMGEDLRRFLADEPILARRSGLTERGWRWCRRNPPLAGAIGAIASALVAVTVIAVLYADHQRQFAAEKTEANQQINKLATNLEVSLKESNRRLAMQFLERSHVAFEKGQIGPGLLWTLAGWRSASEADDPACRRTARASLSAWAAELPPLRAVFSQAGPLIGLAISPDGKTVATRSDNQTVQLWDIATAMPIGPPLHGANSTAILFSPDGKALANPQANAVQLLDPASGRPRSSVPAPYGAYALAFSPDGSQLFIGGWRGGSSTQFWDLTQSRSLGSLEENQGPITSAAFSPDGRTLLTGYHDNQESARFWDTTTRRPLGPPIPHPFRITTVAFSPDGKTALTGCYDGIARLWDVATRKPLDPPLVHAAEIRLVAFTPDGKTILTGSIDRTARLWDAATHAPVGPIYEHQGPIEGGAISPDGRWILTAGGDSTARVCQLDLGRRKDTCVEHNKEVRAVVFSPDGKTFLTGSYDSTAQRWDSVTGRPVGPPLIHPGKVWAAAFSPDGKTILTGCNDRFARLWDVATSRPLATSLEHLSVVSLVAFSPDGKTLMTGSQDQSARLWDAATGKLLGKPLLQHGGVDAGVFSHDGKTLAIGIDLGLVRIWDVRSRKMIGPPIPHPGAVSCLAFGSDDKTLFIGGEDGTVRRWNLETRKPAGIPMRHRRWIYAMALSPDGQMLFTGSWDKTAQLWDADTGMPIGPPVTHPDRVWTVAFSPDSKAVLTGCDDGKARLLPIVPELPEDLERVGVWTEVLTGLSLDDQESVKVLDNTEWRERRDRLQVLGGPPVGDVRSRSAKR